MARKKRVWYPGAEYHVMNRGNRKGDIFLTRKDFEVYLMILGKANQKFPFQLLGYCLMQNHVHLHIKTIDVDLPQIIRFVHLSYSRYFNCKYSLVGQMFQGRYLAKIIDTDQYSIVTNRYIHLNPVKANLVEKAEDYEWSSYRFYIGKTNNRYVKVERTAILGLIETYSNKSYQDFVERHTFNEDDKEIAKDFND